MKMKNKKKKLAKILGIVISTTTIYIPQMIGNVYAEDCDIMFEGPHPDEAQHVLGTKIDCIAGNVFTLAAQVTIGLAIVFTLYTIFKTVVSQGNAKELEAVALRWKYTLIVILLAGVGGTLISFALKFLGFPTFSVLWQGTWGNFITFLNG